MMLSVMLENLSILELALSGMKGSSNDNGNGYEDVMIIPTLLIYKIRGS